MFELGGTGAKEEALKWRNSLRLFTVVSSRLLALGEARQIYVESAFHISR